MSANRTARLLRRLPVVAAVLLAVPAYSSPPASPPQSHPHGNSLADWLNTYLQWYLNTLVGNPTSFETDVNGNTIVGKMVLLNVPNVPGDGTPGSIDINLLPGESFTVPLFTDYGFQYPDGSQDPFQDVKIFKTLNIAVKLDGKTIISGKNVFDFYSKFSVDPPIDLGGGTSVVWAQAISMIHDPLSVGHHKLTLDVVNTIPQGPAFPTFAEFHNTWNITVAPQKCGPKH